MYCKLCNWAIKICVSQIYKELSLAHRWNRKSVQQYNAHSTVKTFKSIFLYSVFSLLPRIQKVTCFLFKMHHNTPLFSGNTLLIQRTPKYSENNLSITACAVYFQARLDSKIGDRFYHGKAVYVCFTVTTVWKVSGKLKLGIQNC